MNTKLSTKPENLAKPLLCDVLLTNDDFSLVNEMRNGMTSFAIKILSEDVFDDELAHNLESFLEDKKIYADMFNVEYMGFLTGQVRVEKIENIIPLINEFLKNIT